jgi:hypothetical protein
MLLGSKGNLLTAHLDEALEGSLCSICALAADTERRHLDLLLYERVNDGSARRRLEAARGFCQAHTALLLEVGGRGCHAKIALLYRGLVLCEAQAVETLEERPARTAAPSAPACSCCRAMARTQETYLGLLARRLGETGFRERYAASHSLCLRHFEALYRASRPLTRRFLREDQARRLRALADDLGEFVRKSVVKTEPFGAERDAWIRVLRLYDGALKG